MTESSRTVALDGADPPRIRPRVLPGLEGREFMIRFLAEGSDKNAPATVANVQPGVSREIEEGERFRALEIIDTDLICWRPRTEDQQISRGPRACAQSGLAGAVRPRASPSARTPVASEGLGTSASDEGDAGLYPRSRVPRTATADSSSGSRPDRLEGGVADPHHHIPSGGTSRSASDPEASPPGAPARTPHTRPGSLRRRAPPLIGLRFA